MNAVILGIGSALPKKCVSNDELPSSLNTSDEWIVSRTGVKQRYVACDGETTASLAVEASAKALLMAKIAPADVDLIVLATVTGDYSFPSTATIVQRNLGIEKAVAFDVGAACSGFIYALDIADSRIRLGKSRCALVIGAETFSRLLDWSDRSTCVLFGDGAGAMVLGAADSPCGVQSCMVYSDGVGIDHLKTSGGISTTQTAGVVEMNGREVFRFAVEKFTESLEELLRLHHMTVDDIDLIVPHQANIRIVEKLMERFNIPREKVLVTIHKHANTSAASIPLSLAELGAGIFSKKNVVLLSVGAGFTWGAALLRFEPSAQPEDNIYEKKR
ncbi:MAG: ketoacyl-ACP synthase III [Holosporaceae bacterium]|jgi:3-oxoacyl-[acyl-carrier-protein] synthase-3|nr:ketoacyl-ACP synthase III [Holosporaceae bacterium]